MATIEQPEKRPGFSKFFWNADSPRFRSDKLDISDIPGVRPSSKLYYASNSDQVRGLTKTQDLSLNTKDIDGASPKHRKELIPREKLRDDTKRYMRVDDINGPSPLRHKSITKEQRENIMNN